jgi:hypothetical protein
MLMLWIYVHAYAHMHIRIDIQTHAHKHPINAYIYKICIYRHIRTHPIASEVLRKRLLIWRHAVKTSLRVHYHEFVCGVGGGRCILYVYVYE